MKLIKSIMELLIRLKIRQINTKIRQQDGSRFFDIDNMLDSDFYGVYRYH